MAKVVKARKLPSRVINKKFMRSYDVAADFFLGATVMKLFEGRWYKGTVDRVARDEDRTLWHVTYSDFDEEELTKDQLATHLAYHPVLDIGGDLQVPNIGDFVWFSEERQPRLGQVLAVDTTLPRPVTVEVWVPETGAGDITRARFVQAFDDEQSAVVTQLTIHQIKLRLGALTSGGRLTATDRCRLDGCLRS